ncbi:nuclear transport factor 2 family protein [uncultured Sphingomonas sp.]|uniref:nuclear transport factor 2 family protein n=1 Tax=uncultured Sphingomonas sp. TaxID=158754 RepID=UPI002622C43F|nr:nuclear transport factor 2 family protein [uncultured Sphingomonas sp.]
MNDCAKLLAIEEIKTLFARRLRYMDTGQWHLYADLHTEDAITETYSRGTAPIAGAQAIAAAIEQFMTGGPAPITSVHHAHTPEIEFLSNDEATGIWPMEDHLWWSQGRREEWLHGYGHYHEHYRRVNDRWLIAWRRLSRLRVDHSPGFYDR